MTVQPSTDTSDPTETLDIRVDHALETLDDMSDTASCLVQVGDVVADLWAAYEAARDEEPAAEAAQWKSIAFHHLNQIMVLEEKLAEYETRDERQSRADFTEQIKTLFTSGGHH